MSDIVMTIAGMAICLVSAFLLAMSMYIQSYALVGSTEAKIFT